MNEELVRLIEGIKDKREESFERLYLLTKDRIRFFLLSRGLCGEDLSEVMSDAYVVVFEKAGKFRGKSQVLTWMLGIVNVKLKEYFRKNKRKPTQIQEIPDLRNYELEAALSADLKLALKSLSKEEYNLFLYRICFEMTYEEINRILKIPIEELRQKVFELRRKLKSRIGERR